MSATKPSRPEEIRFENSHGQEHRTDRRNLCLVRMNTKKRIINTFSPSNLVIHRHFARDRDDESAAENWNSVAFRLFFRGHSLRGPCLFLNTVRVYTSDFSIGRWRRPQKRKTIMYTSSFVASLLNAKDDSTYCLLCFLQQEHAWRMWPIVCKQAWESRLYA